MNTLTPLDELLREAWEARLQEDPLFATQVGDGRYNDRLPEVSAEAEARRLEQARGFQARLRGIDRAALDLRQQVNVDVFAWELENTIATIEYGAYWMPVTRLTGPHSYLPDLVLLTPFRTELDYHNYYARLNGLPAFIDQTIALMRAGKQQGWMPPRAALAGIEDSLRALLVDAPQASAFSAPFQQFPPTMPGAVQTKLQTLGRQAVEQSVMPAFAALLRFVEEEYLPAARQTIAIRDLPGGEEYYAFLVRKFTTLDVSPREVHATGVAEVQRIRAEMQALMEKIGFGGAFQEFLHFLRTDPQFYATSPGELMREVALIMKQMDGELPRLFSHLPRTPYGMRETPASIAPRSTSAYYFPATGDGTTAGYYYVNTFNLPNRPLYEYEALSFHEAVPGHHLQIALQQEMRGVPDFRRYAGVDAFIEGWALYAERLGLEVGFYKDPYRDFGRLIFEMWRATRLVVDTGIHQFGWSRQQAIDYMLEHTALSPLNIENEVDRYIAWPGQALAYKMGEIKIRALRARAEQALGEAFDLRAFHRVLLEEGAIPLSIVEQRIANWVKEAAAV